MSEVLITVAIVVAALLAAAYLLAPLRIGSGRGRGRLLLLMLMLLPAATARLASPISAAAADERLSVALLLIAVDAQRDHLRISEALRLVNLGPPRAVGLTIALPPGARYLTVHRGMDQVRPAPGGFAGRVRLMRGTREVIYSYALAAGRAERLTRAYPLAVRRVEIVVRGPGVRMRGSRGGPLPPLEVGGARLSRWEAAGLAPGAPITVDLEGLPVNRMWFAVSAAAVFAAALAAGLTAAARARPPRDRGEVEESPPVRRT